MKRSRFTEDQIIGILRERQAGVPVSDLCRTPLQMQRIAEVMAVLSVQR